MDERKEVGIIVESLEVTGIGLVGDSDITEVDKRVLEDGGSCNGVDIGVGVLGSKVNSDGTYASFDHDEWNKEGLERGSNGLDCEAGAIGDSGLLGISNSGAQLMHSPSEIEQDVGGHSTAAYGTEEAKLSESIEAGELADDGVRHGEVSGDGGGGNIAYDRISEGVDVDARTVGNVNRIEGSSALETSTDRGILAKEVVVISIESWGGELVNEVENGAENKSEDTSIQDGDVPVSESQDQRVENGARDYSKAIVGSSDFVNEAALIVEKSVIKDAKRSEGMEVDSKAQKVDVLRDKTTNYATEATISTSSTVIENSSVETQVVEQDHMVLVNNKSSNPKVEASSIDPIQGTTRGDFSGAIMCKPGSDSFLMEKGGVASTMSETLDEQTQVTCDRNASPMEQNEIAYSNIEDLQSSYQPIQVVGGEGATSENEAPLSSVQIHSNVATNMGLVGQKVTDSARSGLQEEHTVSVSGHHIEAQTVNASSENCSNVYLHSAVSCHSIRGVEVLKIDHGDRVSHNMVSCSSGNDQRPRTQTGCEAMEIDVLKHAGDDKSGFFHTARVDSKVGQVTEVPKAEHLKVSDKIVELNSGYSTTCASTGLDNQYMDGRDIGKTSNDEHLRPVVLSQGDQQYEVGHIVEQEMTVEGIDDAEQLGSPEEQEMEVDSYNDGEHSETAEDNSVKLTSLGSGSAVSEHQATYHLPPDDKSEFSVSDLVWGKVKSHPWWPGQIFDSSDASEKAMKYQKKDCYLVAYFGDRTFAWNEASQLKSLRSHFSQVEKQSSMESFQNAVDCALEEVSRRVELGLSCTCMPKDAYDEIKFQMVESAGIQEESSIREGVDKSMGTDLFEPTKLVEYMKELAQSPCAGADRLELAITRSQLLAFYRLKGYTELPEFQAFGESLENEGTLDFEDASPVFCGDGQTLSGQDETQQHSYRKRKHNLKEEGIFPNKKERSLTELMDDSWHSVNDQMGNDENTDGKLLSPASGKKRKVSDPFADETTLLEGRKTISLAKVSTASASLPKPSFKIGECIRRVASQMTGSPSILKSNSPKLDSSVDWGFGERTDSSFQLSEEVDTKKATDPTEYSSLYELLSQLHSAAQDPLKGYNFFNVIISFFSDFRNSIILNQHDKIGSTKRKSASAFPETFEFEDMSDTYWTDRVIQNGGEEEHPLQKGTAEEHPSRKNRKRDIFVPISLNNKTPHGSVPRKRYSESVSNQFAEKPPGYVDENAPAELVMHFPVVDSVPSEMSLNKMFRRFGPIKESETEVDRDTNRARVVFRKCLDAEAAYGSASKFNIFGQMVVNYQLNYSITIPFKSVPIATTEGMEDDASIFLEF